MRRATIRTAAWGLGAAVIAVAGAALMARADLARQREAFETDARIAHRLLSQRVVQHEAILATLVLLQPGPGDAADRLPSVYPQVLRVLQRDRDAPWPDAALAAADARSRQLRRAVLVGDPAGREFGAGRYTVLQAADPTSYALVVDLKALVPRTEWPLPDDGPVRCWLDLDGRAQVLQPGRDAAGGWRFEFAKHLAAESQPFDLRASRRVGWAELPWGAMAAWVLAVSVVVAALAAWQGQRGERRRAEELLRLGQIGRLNALGELAAGMAHELNQPLTALLANTRAAQRLLDDDPPDVATARAAMGQAADQARRAAEVVGRLRRTVEQPDRGAAAAVPVPLLEAARNVMFLLEPECRRRGVEVAWQLPPSPPTVRADPVALEQVVHNLVMNALQAMEQVPAAERRLTLVLGSEGGFGVLRVRDHGPGFGDAVMLRLFEPFFTTREGGLGLGLSLCETLVVGMGGALTAGRAEPRGAEFRVDLPLAGDAAGAR